MRTSCLSREIEGRSGSAFPARATCFRGCAIVARCSLSPPAVGYGLGNLQKIRRVPPVFCDFVLAGFWRADISLRFLVCAESCGQFPAAFGSAFSLSTLDFPNIPTWFPPRTQGAFRPGAETPLSAAGRRPSPRSMCRCASVPARTALAVCRDPAFEFIVFQPRRFPNSTISPSRQFSSLENFPVSTSLPIRGCRFSGNVLRKEPLHAGPSGNYQILRAGCVSPLSLGLCERASFRLGRHEVAIRAALSAEPEAGRREFADCR